MKRPKTLKNFTMLVLVLTLSINLAPLTPIASAANQAFAQEDSKLSPELKKMAFDVTSTASESVRVIVQTRASLEQIDENINSKGGRVKRSLPLIGGYVAEIPRSSLAAIAFDDDTVYVSLDRQTQLLQLPRYDNNLVRVTTGAENITGRDGISSRDLATRDYLNSLRAGPNGKNVTIAVLDSGIYDDGALHEDLRSIGDSSVRRVLARRNFVQAESADTNVGADPYGHGTHGAGLPAGRGRGVWGM